MTDACRRRAVLRGLPMTLAALLLLVASSASSQRRGASDGPSIEIEPAEFDFGSVRQNQRIVHEFVLRNVGSEDLEVRKIATSCGCAAALVSERVLAPGAETILRVTLETRRYRGRTERSVAVASNDRRRPVAQVRVQAFVEASDQ